VPDDRTTDFLNRLTANGAAELGFESRDGGPRQFWLGGRPLAPEAFAAKAAEWPGANHQDPGTPVAAQLVTDAEWWVMNHGHVWPPRGR
jgi:hypothetical protein